MQGVQLQALYRRSAAQAPFSIDPVRDLLIWAIVQNRKELADIIWAQVNFFTFKPSLHRAESNSFVFVIKLKMQIRCGKCSFVNVSIESSFSISVMNRDHQYINVTYN